MLLRKFLTYSVLLFLATTSIEAAAPRPPREMLGLHLGMSEEAARSRLRKIGAPEGKEGGKQEVWKLRAHPHFDYLIIRFHRKSRHLWFVMAVVRPGGRVRYRDVADIKSARHGSDGNNYTYTWKGKAHGREPSYVVVARGSDPQYLTSYSIYTLTK